ncbi:MAG: hypothetical protein COT24_00040 [Candidatus Kerfeldbacteria bacterium CG08_land_8_20_14_0_20_40_16]|uniref:Translation elongation factor EFTu-like domain-containing protein n=1 Tax=Candidatus Kerfeldbacteria bacterium CG08_land_8_20_14_0_20_40_16 TaxID=2014244 RepID=A0A2H0YX77_9BACT|nr:MAG: hypothetical protein COT24_00040 [Candidatus Kerfeldbacteria bacterium CG08_land_8_20_14_0_20_40_16]
MGIQGGNLEDFRGKVIKVFNHIRCVGIEVKKGTLNKGDILMFVKDGSLSLRNPKVYKYTQRIDSIEIDHQPVDKVEKRQRCGVKINIPIPGTLPPNGAVVTRVPAG